MTFGGPLLPLLLAAAPGVVSPAAGVFLVAKPTIDGGPFYHSVVLLLAHGDEGTLGVIINRTTEIPLSEVMKDLEEGDVDPVLHFGGPVALDGLLFVFRSKEPPKPSEGPKGVMGDVFFSGDRKLLEKLLKNKDAPERLKVYVGHAGWAPGQLDGEIFRGDWTLVRADAFTLFQKSPDAIWPELSKAGITVARSGRPSRPSSRSAPSGER
jgi:putative transcriptional regulator